MKKLFATLVAMTLVLGVLAGPSALAGKKKKKKKAPVTREITFEESGSMIVPGPTGAALFGLTEAEFTQVHTCAQMPASQGVDGWVIEVPEEFRLGTATVEVVGADASGAHDFDLYFYDAGCSLMADVWLQDGADPTGAIPGGASWMVIEMIVGGNATFDLKATATITE